MIIDVNTTITQVAATTPHGTGYCTYAHKFKALLTEVGLWELVAIGTNTGGKVHICGMAMIPIIFLEFGVGYHTSKSEIAVVF